MYHVSICWNKVTFYLRGFVFIILNLYLINIILYSPSKIYFVQKVALVSPKIIRDIFFFFKKKKNRRMPKISIRLKLELK